MSKVRTFSRAFPSNHPRKGEATYFVEKFLKSFENEKWYAEKIYELGSKLGYMYVDEMLTICDSVYPKSHTIRAGNSFKAHDKFSPRIWSGKPYKSKQVIIAPDIEVKKVWNIQIEFTPNQTIIMIPTDSHSQFQLLSLGEVAANDGLTIEDFINWFNPKRENITFQGQIICWNENIEY